MAEVSSLTPRQQMLSAGAGSLVVSLFMTPLDVVKIRLQAQERLYSKKCFLYSNGLMDHLCPRTNGDPPSRAMHTAQVSMEICDCKWFNRPKYFNGTFDAIVKISRLEGISSLWSGLSPTLVLAIPTTVTYFTMYEQLKVMIDQMRRKHSADTNSHSPSWVSLTAGGLARWFAVTIVNPLELTRTKMQSQKMPWSQVTKCLRDLVSTQGVRGLWNGYTATLLRDVPFSALYWPLYEATRVSIYRHTSQKHVYLSMFPDNSFLINFVSGAVAGSIASTITLPFDVIKTIKQIEMGEKDIMKVKAGQARSNMTIAKELISEQGVKSLFSGITPRLLKVAPACAIMISSYEFCKDFFGKQNKERSQT